MELTEFLYDLPQSLIAAYPTEDRSRSRLMVLRRSTGEILDERFSSLANYLSPGDLLVRNDSKVIPARLRGRKESGGSAEVLLLESFPGWQSLWIALVDASKEPRVGSRLFFDDGIYAEIIGEMGRGRYGLRFHHRENFAEVLGKLGGPPLPPYIRKQRDLKPLDWERYQTVYASEPGSVAAPTAGFHFTEEHLQSLQSRGIEVVSLTLHVGPGTFQPVRESEIERHRMAGEWYALAPEAAEKIRRAKRGGNRIIAIGTTTTRALEWIAQRKGQVEADQGIARLYICPGTQFRVISGLVTNFHLPASTNLILVATFAGLEFVRRAYDEAVRRKFRFYSYGDAMLIL